MTTLIQDLKYGLRLLRKNPGFTAVAVLTLALGIGATTAIFSVVNTVLLQPLPYPRAKRIVQLVVSFPQGKAAILSVPQFMAMRQAEGPLEDFTLYDIRGPGVNLTGGARPEQIKGIQASANYFQLFGAPVALGRPYSAAEDQPGGPRVAVISYGLWQSRFGAIVTSWDGPSNWEGRPTWLRVCSAAISIRARRLTSGCLCKPIPKARTRATTCWARRC